MKTKIVYCKDANRRGDFEHTSFDFLGYTFRARLAQVDRGATSAASPRPSAQRRRRRSASRSGPGTSTVAAARTCPASLRPSTLRSGAGSTTTDASTAPSCTSSHGASTSTWPDGPCTSSNDSAASSLGRCLAAEGVSTPARPVRPLAARRRSPQAGLWGPDDGRPSRPVLRAAGGETPPADSPASRSDSREVCVRSEPDDRSRGAGRLRLRTSGCQLPADQGIVAIQSCVFMEPAERAWWRRRQFGQWSGWPGGVTWPDAWRAGA